ncbi:MAG: NAD(P)H-hydrate epimerase [Candidatus Omnitrophota bacterium]
MKIVTSERMAEIDRKAQEEYGISALVLMENAGRAVADVIISDLNGSLKEAKIGVFCGKGNNGGDGFVTARYFANELVKDLIVYVPDEGQIKSGPAFENFQIIQKMGIEIKPIRDFLALDEKRCKNFSLAVDAFFGTGFKGSLSDDYGRVAERVTCLNIRCYSIDVPSGLNADTGEILGSSFKAFKTITFGLAKQGFFTKQGPDACGEVIVKNIGFPSRLLE